MHLTELHGRIDYAELSVNTKDKQKLRKTDWFSYLIASAIEHIKIIHKDAKINVKKNHRC